MSLDDHEFRSSGDQQRRNEVLIGALLNTKNIAFAVVGGLLFLTGLLIGLSGRQNPFAAIAEPPTMMQCTKNALEILALKEAPTTETLGQTREYCYSTIMSQGLLTDFYVRKLNYIQQYYANGILMWMVVVITVSGVVLAAIQFLASYQLAKAQRTTLAATDEISLKQDQIVLKSSVTGLFILVISFAFFLVFVLYVYRFEQPISQEGQVSPKNLPLGKLGPPPNAPPR